MLKITEAKVQVSPARRVMTKPAEYKIVPAKYENGPQIRMGRKQVTISKSLKIVNIDGYDLPVNVVHSLATGEYKDVKGITSVKKTERYFTEEFKVNWLTIPMGAKLTLKNISTNYSPIYMKQVEYNGLTVQYPRRVTYADLPLRTIEVISEFRIRGYRIKRINGRVKIGCQSASITDLKSLSKYIKKLTK